MNSVYAVEISSGAQRQMTRLPRDVQDRIIARLHALHKGVHSASNIPHFELGDFFMTPLSESRT